MFKKTDPYSFTKFSNLLFRTEEGNYDTVGSVFFEYQVTLYEDVQSNGSSSIYKAKNQKFLLNCTQRINIFNPDGLQVSPSQNINSYNDYPAMVNTFISLNGAQELLLTDYSPQTVNSQIQMSLSQGDSDGTTNTNTTSNTVGSSVSQTNTFGTSVTVGDISGATASYEHSSTVSKDRSRTTGADVSNSQTSDSSNAASMSIKDWGAYALVNPTTKNPSWTFGQEYPWNVFDCRKTNGTPNDLNEDQVQLIIPSAMLDRLYNGGSLYPPSELSMYGVNFVMKASWLVVIDNDASDEITIDHTINYSTASHILSGSTVSVYIDQVPIILNGDNNDSLSTALNLNFMALSPLGALSNAAIVGFIPNKFITKPVPATDTTAPVPFKIISTTNDLMIMDTTTYPTPCGAGAGFIASETCLSAGFSADCAALEMTMYFKVIDSVSNYTLYMKHWKTGKTGVVLTMVINDDPDNTITQYVDSLEAEGGENNLLAIALRNQNFASVDYHDYLQLGLNSIKITIQPIGSTYTADCGYQIRAVSIENA